MSYEEEKGAGTIHNASYWASPWSAGAWPAPFGTPLPVRNSPQPQRRSRLTLVGSKKAFVDFGLIESVASKN